MVKQAALEAVLFDLDGVIVDTARFHYLAWKRLADRENIPFDETINERLKGVSRIASLNIILEKSTRAFSPEEKEEMVKQKNDWYLQSIRTITPEDILPGVRNLLDSLQQQGIATAICSASKNAEMILKYLQLTDNFDVIVGGDDVARPKPDPEVFMLAADKLAIPYTNCVVLEDSFAGIQAARSAKMKSVGIGSIKFLWNAGQVFDNIQQVTLPELEKLFQYT